jgi:hypothetical protein
VLVGVAELEQAETARTRIVSNNRLAKRDFFMITSKNRESEKAIVPLP